MSRVTEMKVVNRCHLVEEDLVLSQLRFVPALLIDQFRATLTVDLFEKQRDVVVIKWKSSTEHHVENHSTAPHINLWSSIEFSGDDFRLIVYKG